MASKLIFKDNNEAEFSVTHEDNTGALAVTSLELSKVKTIDTIADLRAMEVTPDTVWVSGYYDKGDGAFGSNIFEWDATSTETDNGGTIIKLDGVATGRYLLRYSGSVNVKWFGAVGDGVADTLSINHTAFSTCFSTIDEPIFIPEGNYRINGFLYSGIGKISGAGTQKTKLYYDGDMAVSGTFFKYGSGTILEDFRILGGFSDTQDVNNNLIGFSDSDGVGIDGRANRAFLKNVRAESFGINFYFSGTQNQQSIGLFSQYAKYAEYYFYDTENNWVTSANSNSSLQIGLTPDDDYKLIRLEGNRNLQFNQGIHERSVGISNPYIIDSGGATFRGVEFNGAVDVVWSLVNSSGALFDRCYWTLTGNEEKIVKTDASSIATVISPSATGTNGKSIYSLLEGNCSDSSDNSASITLFTNSKLSNYYNSSGGAGYIVDGALVVTGTVNPKGVVMQNATSNNTFTKEDGDLIIGVKITIVCTEMSGCSSAGVYLSRPSPFWRVGIGSFDSVGVHEFLYTPVDGVELASIQIGVNWDGETTDPTYGDVGVVTIASRYLEIYKGDLV